MSEIKMLDMREKQAMEMLGQICTWLSEGAPGCEMTKEELRYSKTVAEAKARQMCSLLFDAAEVEDYMGGCVMCGS